MELVLGLLLALVPSAMLDPQVDAGPQFEYFGATSGWLVEAPPARGRPRPLAAGLRVTEAGHLACLEGRLVLLAGEPLQPVFQRVKTWSHGALPMLIWEDHRAGATLRCQALAAPVPGEAQATGLLRVSVRAGDAPVRLNLAIGFLPDAGLPVLWPLLDREAQYSADDGVLQRNGRLLAVYPRAASARFSAKLDREQPGAFSLAALGGDRHSLVGVGQYALTVSARRIGSLVFKLSGAPAQLERLPDLRRLDFDETALRESERWTAELTGAPMVSVPEEKVTEACRYALLRLRSRGVAWPGAAEELSPATGARLRRAADERGLVLVREAAHQFVLSPWWTARRGQAWLAAGRPEAALAALYAVLLHSGATHELADAVPVEWSARERLSEWGVPDDRRPATALLQLVWAMLAQTRGERLVLLDGLPPAWVPTNGTATAERIPTASGPVDLSWSWRESALVVDFARMPSVAGGVVLRCPYWLPEPQATVDGQPVRPVDGLVAVAAGARRMVLKGALAAPPTTPSFSGAVAAYRAAYRERAESYVAAGGQFSALRPAWPEVAEGGSDTDGDR